MSLVRKFAFVCTLLIHISILGTCQSDAKYQKDKWFGFERINFDVAGHAAYIVRPNAPLAGNIWIWRASFPDWHTDMDSILLSKGVFVAYISVDDQYGSPYAVQVWDRFYNYLTDSFSFAKKMALEGVSRGGLYVYAWAKRNPDKVNCIYNEGPVCDIKSWPGAKGRGRGDSACWRQLQQVYGMTEQELMNYDDNPIDHLEGLASFKVPVLHITGLQDEYAPAEENTNVLIRRYQDLGGPVSVFPVTAGPQLLGGHHYPIEHPDLWAGYILQNSYPVRPTLQADDYIQIRSGLKNSYRVFSENKKATVGFLGGSITYNPGWREKVIRYLNERFPKTDFHFISAGIPSLGSLPHAFRLQRDLLDSGKIDLLFVEAAVNDRVNGTDSLVQLLSLEGIVRHAKSANPLMDIVLMSFADEDKNKDYDHGITPADIKNQEMVSAWYGLPSINLAKEIHDKIVKKEFSWEYDFKDVHPSPLGQELYFSAIKRLMTVCYDSGTKMTSRQNTEARLAKPIHQGNLQTGIYDDIKNATHDEGWKYVAEWSPDDRLATRDGFVHVPMLVSTVSGSTLELKFSGNAVGIAVVSGADAGFIKYSIDRGPFHQRDLYTQWSSMLYLPWYILLAHDLKDKNHVLTLRIKSEKNSASRGNACRIAYFLVNK